MGKKKSAGNASAKAAKKVKAAQKIEKKEKKAFKSKDEEEDLEGILEKVFSHFWVVVTGLITISGSVDAARMGSGSYDHGRVGRGSTYQTGVRDFDRVPKR